MKIIVIDGALMPTREAAHAYLAQRLSLPEHYGRNLDALYDVLSADTSVSTCLVLYRREALEQSLGSYGASLLDVLADAARVNPYLQAVIDGGETDEAAL